VVGRQVVIGKAQPELQDDSPLFGGGWQRSASAVVR
jgi:hypothetical protein